MYFTIAVSMSCRRKNSPDADKLESIISYHLDFKPEIGDREIVENLRAAGKNYANDFC
jgi:hypothetical protein